MGFSSGYTPFYNRVMGFIDGSNFLIELSKELKIPFRADKPPFPALQMTRDLINNLFHGYGKVPIRKYWFASYKGNEEYHMEYAVELRRLDFEPVLFKKENGKEKGVDIALATEMLVNAFNQNYDIGVLVAGDRDYEGLVKEVKRYGPIIEGAFFEHGLAKELSISVDVFYDIMKRTNANFKIDPWAKYIAELKDELGKNSNIKV